MTIGNGDVGLTGIDQSALPELQITQKTSPIILRAGLHDLNTIRAIEKEAFVRDSYPLLDLIGVLSLPFIVRLKAEVGGKIAGFVFGERLFGIGKAWVTNLRVAKRFRRQGIGFALLRACEEGLEASRVHLCVRCSNQPAIQLYKRSGYREVRILQRYYQDGEDAFLMEKDV